MGSPRLMSEYGGDPRQMRDNNGKLGHPVHAISCGAGGNPRKNEEITKMEIGYGNGNGVGWPSPTFKVTE